MARSGQQRRGQPRSSGRRGAIALEPRRGRRPAGGRDRSGLGRRQLGFQRWRSGMAWGAAAMVVLLVCRGARRPAHPRSVRRSPGERAAGHWPTTPSSASRSAPSCRKRSCPGRCPCLRRPAVGPDRRRRPRQRALGLWHVLPSIGIVDVNPVAKLAFDGRGDRTCRWPAGDRDDGGRARPVRARYGSGSLLAPVIVRTTTNSLGYALAWLFS